MKEQDLREKFSNLDSVIISDCGNRQMCIPNGKMTENTINQCVQIAKDYAEKEAIEFAEWMHEKAGYAGNGHYAVIGNTGYHTITKLYQLFKNRENER